MNNPENAQAKSLIINYVVIILLLSLLWLLYEGVRLHVSIQLTIDWIKDTDGRLENIGFDFHPIFSSIDYLF